MEKFKLSFDNPKSYTGMSLTPLPKMSFTSNRSCTISKKKFSQWLIENTKEQVKNDDYKSTLVSCVNYLNMSKADYDMLNLFLFGETSVQIDYLKLN